MRCVSRDACDLLIWKEIQNPAIFVFRVKGGREDPVLSRLSGVTFIMERMIQIHWLGDVILIKATKV
eukprot:SAG11_NODE_40959_length_199_cov_19.310000_1_plen_66_part_11